MAKNPSKHTSKQEEEIIEDLEKPKNRNLLMRLAIVLFAVAGIVALVYLYATSNQVYIDKGVVMATMIDLSSTDSGKLEKVFVKEGDSVTENETVAQVGNGLVKAKKAGIVVKVDNSVGKIFAPGETVITCIDPKDLRVDAQIEEDKGLNEIKVGQKAFFTVDAFPGKQYVGIVDEVGATSRQSDVVFNISDQRQENQFDVKIRFDTLSYPELKNGMSTKNWVYKD